MSDIQRYDAERFYGTGQFVTYADHVEALRREFEAGRGYQQERLTNHDMHSGFACLTNYEQGVRDALAGAVQRVEALVEVQHADFAGYYVNTEAVKRAIKGDSDE